VEDLTQVQLNRAHCSSGTTLPDGWLVGDDQPGMGKKRANERFGKRLSVRVHEVVLSCMHARRQLLSSVPTAKPTLTDLSNWRMAIFQSIIGDQPAESTAMVFL
jgi:hypothetical protein